MRTGTLNMAHDLLRLAAWLACASVVGCGSKTDASRANFTAGMNAYLGKRGDLCIGRPRWPVDLQDEGVDTRAPDALQLPVLERLGLVKSAPLPVRVDGAATPFGQRRFRLTAAGRERYLDRASRAPVSPDEPGAAAHADFCVARLGLATVAGWEVQQGAPPTALVSYTYTVDAPAWTNDAGFQAAFPAVARVLRGAGTARLVEGFTSTPDGWTANELLGRKGAAPQAAAP